ncbi:hypothetical protein [Microbacterium sp. A93]|uniref:hypothetical protein n=1 Tax=Microbacterium sp. A93 TaxID=3450716 RepID=UPI003F443EAB
MSRPPAGTFRIYPAALPPITIGRYVVDGEIEIIDVADKAAAAPQPIGTPVGTFEQLQGAFDVEGPRYQLPPDQVLSTYPPSGSRGAYSRRLPQIVIKRRTLPWEWSMPPGQGGAPMPWLALVLIGPGEGTIVVDRPIAECVTSGTTLPHPDVFDTPKGTYLKVPQSVVTRTFPTADDLPLLTHVREVDMSDTELAIGDDDGWLAVILCNRLPQAGVTYTACLINIDSQTAHLPDDPAVENSFDPFSVVFDIGEFTQVLANTHPVSVDAAVMGATQVGSVAAAEAVAGYAVANTGAAWAAGTKRDVSMTVPVTAGVTSVSAQPLLGMLNFPYELLDTVRHFPVLTSWSFTCDGDGDFATLANEVSSRLLGDVASAPEDPDGGPRTKDLPTLTEPPSNRPLPLVTESGHIVTAYRTRVGDESQAYFRGPLIPNPSVRPTPGDSDRVVLAHHADQLRLIVPDGLQDLTYSSAFEIGRLLALSRPGVVALLARWRREKFAAAATAAVQAHVFAQLPSALRESIRMVDPLRQGIPIAVGIDLPGPTPDRFEKAPTGRQFIRGLLSALDASADEIASPLPAVNAGFARDDTAKLTRSRATRLAKGLALDVDLTVPAEELARQLASTPLARAERDQAAELAGARIAMEGLVAELIEGADALQSGGIEISDILGRMR